MNKINLGCGQNPKEGFINIDCKYDNRIKPDIVWDLEKGLPFIPTNSIEEVNACMILEHINNYEFLMREVHRILKHMGRFIIVVPDSNGTNAWGHPGHVRGFNMTSFKYFHRDTAEFNAYNPDIEFRVLKQETNGEIITAVLEAVK